MSKLTMTTFVTLDGVMQSPGAPKEDPMHGSCGLVQTLLANDLVDEFHLVMIPITLGHGKRLFGEGTIPTAFKHLSTRTTGAGIVIATYQHAGRPSYGQFGDTFA